jgi:hypothetical protein
LRATRARILASIATAVTVAVLFMTPPTWAQGYGRSLALSGFAGYNLASDIYNGNSGVNNASLELKNGFMWGGRLTAFTSEYSAVEFAYTRNQSDLAIKQNSGALPTTFATGSLGQDEYDLNFLISQPGPNPRVWPFFSLGFGWTVTSPDIQGPTTPSATLPNPKSNSLFAFNFGAGTMVAMGSKLALRLDARWRVTDTAITTSSGVYCDYWGYCWSYASDWYNSGEFSAGLTYHLGGH